MKLTNYFSLVLLVSSTHLTSALLFSLFCCHFFQICESQLLICNFWRTNPAKWLTFIVIFSLPVRTVAWTWYPCTNTYTHNHNVYEKRSYVRSNIFAGNRHGNCSTYHDIRERGGDWLCGTLLWSVWNIHWWVPIVYIVIILRFVNWI